MTRAHSNRNVTCRHYWQEIKLPWLEICLYTSYQLTLFGLKADKTLVKILLRAPNEFFVISLIT